ncbi:hypothetical protein LXL04_003060 [Taraxacum kok-saghyz]
MYKPTETNSKHEGKRVLICRFRLTGVCWPPRRINVFVWRACLGRLPTRSNLAKRGIVPQASLCPWCNRVEETENHILLEWSTTKELQAHLLNWWGCSAISSGTTEVSNLFLCPSAVKLEIAWRAYLWVLWKFRNETIFEGKTWNNKQLVMEVKLLSFNWFRSRGKILVTAPECLVKLDCITVSRPSSFSLEIWEERDEGGDKYGVFHQRLDEKKIKCQVAIYVVVGLNGSYETMAEGRKTVVGSYSRWRGPYVVVATHLYQLPPLIGALLLQQQHEFSQEICYLLPEENALLFANFTAAEFSSLGVLSSVMTLYG